MKVSLQSLEERDLWEGRGYILPRFSFNEVRGRTREQPIWFHFGAGNIARAFPAVLQQRLLNEGLADRGIILGEAYDEEIIDRALTPYDNLTIVVTLKSSGEIKKEVVASVTESIKPRTDISRTKEIFSSLSLQIVSFTITEKGYALRDSRGDFLPWVKKDLEQADTIPTSIPALVAWFCYERYRAGGFPLALVSMDNFSQNGSVLYDSVMTFVHDRVSRGAWDAGFIDYMTDDRRISFNWSMIDKITPRPSEQISLILKEDGLEEMDSFLTGKGTYTAPFVNAEEIQYLAVEDVFPNGRPPLEKVGVLFADRRTIDRIDKMKVCTCLNPLHTILAIYGCLLGYTSISEEMKNPLLKRFIELVGYDEGMPVAADPGILNARAFLKEVIEVRFPNPFLPDSPQRIATDTSKKIPIRFGETLKAYARDKKDSLASLFFIPLFFAGWFRYLMGLDDEGHEFTLSPDPNLPEVTAYVAGINLGDPGPFTDKLKPFLSRADIFGIDLYQYGLGEKVEKLFTELIQGPGAVEQVLRRYVHPPLK